MTIISSIAANLILAAAGGPEMLAIDVIRSGEVVTPAMIATEAGDGPGMSDPIIGREARRTIYTGQPVSMENTRPARLVSRNQVVTLKYIKGGLEISTTGRAMGEGALNETISVLNVESRKLVTGTVQADGWVLAQ
ncbi:flagellar basal body P-ring formation chaperone FlgA [Henriciella litoralis]|uniref:flagellar basal body P-ring formation chaperone FlgA n=1 Tax=Henriciella litoralis TaxID=568102 RepID=UPI0009FF5341|nr:flagellar basal body P-ring formation chaperone FlgA [Henriciella litoralis]